MEKTFTIDQLETVALELLKAFPQQRIFLFYGKMGVGKTTFIKVLTKVLGVTETVSSPTFSLVNEYKNNLNQSIFHFDFYRINKETEALDMGVEEYFDSGAYCLIEWAEKIKNLVPLNAVSVMMEEMPNGSRRMEAKIF